MDQAAACVEARIAITPAPAKGKQAAGLSGIEDLGNLVIPSWLVDLAMLGPWIAAPGKNMLGVKGGWEAVAFGRTRG